MEILKKYNEGDLLLPFLLIRCEKDPLDSALRQLLFNAYMSKLGKFNYSLKNEKAIMLDGFKGTNDMLNLLRQKETLEHDIK